MKKTLTAYLFLFLFLFTLPAFAQTSDPSSRIASLIAQIKILQAKIAELQGGATNVRFCVRLSNNLYLGQTDATTNGEVTKLQHFLAQDRTVYPEATVSGYFGPLTEAAVKRWQAKHNIVSSGTPFSTGYGYVGPRTRTAIAVCSPLTRPSTPDEDPIIEDEEDDDEIINNPKPDFPTPDPDDPDERKYNDLIEFLSDRDLCQPEMTTFAPWGDTRPAEVFALYDKRTADPNDRKSWHHAVNHCLDNLLTAANDLPLNSVYDLIYHQALYELARPEVVFYKKGSGEKLRFSDVIQDDGRLDTSTFNRIAFTNDYGIAYNSMLQIDLGQWLLEAHYELLRNRGSEWSPEKMNDLKILGLATVKVITDPIKDGGLTTRHACELRTEYDCSFYHSVTGTSRTSAASGGTLNQHLIAVRDLATSASTLERIDKQLGSANHRSDIKQLRTAAEEGLNQMVYAAGNTAPGNPPNFIDFIPKPKGVDRSDVRIQQSWLFYSVNPLKQTAYFLDPKNKKKSDKLVGEGGAYKNCAYNLLVINLLESTIKRLPEFDVSGFTTSQTVLNDLSLIEFLLGTYAEKLTANGLPAPKGLYVDSDSPKGGFFGACSAEVTKPLKQSTIDYLEGLRS